MAFEVYTFEFSDKIYAAETLNFRSASGGQITVTPFTKLFQNLNQV